ncbi:hypothetical protein SAMN04488540_101268 [Ferrimonas sediminum]|uniref:Uncharacterized protein n=1 Tax=Ferrimonas sediminum TaxID=718193 RepID=A0A1G8K645_9GAMM|nr:hypothetical protein SAMN04488540_101268 [Ferrimonas sediminum]
MLCIHGIHLIQLQCRLHANFRIRLLTQLGYRTQCGHRRQSMRYMFGNLVRLDSLTFLYDLSLNQRGCSTRDCLICLVIDDLNHDPGSGPVKWTTPCSPTGSCTYNPFVSKPPCPLLAPKQASAANQFRADYQGNHQRLLTPRRGLPVRFWHWPIHCPLRAFSRSSEMPQSFLKPS